MLRARQLDALDYEHLIAFLEDMAARDRRELGSRVTILLTRMLKFEQQPENVTQSWIDTVAEQQDEIEDMLQKAPSLRTEVSRHYADANPRAVRRAAMETHSPTEHFPSDNPWPTLGDALAYKPPPVPESPSRPRWRR